MAPPIAALADTAPEPESAQGEYNPLAPEAPLALPLLHAAPARKAELLAPAGGLDAAFAAFHYGADAVYLGLKKFSARAEAENFTLEELDEIAGFAHALERRRRVFVTVNTLILQHELAEAIEALGALAEIGVDALIVQDLGVYRLVRRYFPELELHASTQMAVHNRAGAEALRRMGFTRVVLARELTFEEVRAITAATGIETEVFVHGTLCYSYSGLCLFSSQTIGRSGNRGKCAYTCRDGYTITGAPETLRDGTPVKRDPGRGFPFSMKDLALPDHLPALQAAGVSCFKIEGRKKSPLYVATTTDYYRRLLDGGVPTGERAAREADLQTVFSRPWTRLFVQSHKDKEVADRDATSHRGAPIGLVEALREPGTPRARVGFTTARRLELHDGLQVDLPGYGQPFGFAVERLYAARVPAGARREAEARKVYEAPAGAWVEVEIPEDHPPIPLGARVYCSSSQAVKQRFRHSRPRPGQYRSRRPISVTLKISVEEMAASARAEPRAPGGASVESAAVLAGPFAPAKDPARTEAAARGAFEKLGERGLTLGALEVRNPAGLFVPVSRLNELRRTLAADLEARLREAAKLRVQAVQRAELTSAAAPAARPATALRWSVKVDRIGFLDAFTATDWKDVDEVVVDVARDPLPILEEKVARLAAHAGRERIRFALPALTRAWEEADLRRKLACLREAGWLKWEAANLGAWSCLGLDAGADGPAAGLDLATDWSVYVLNAAAARQVLGMGARRFTLSPEDGLENLRELLAEFGARATVIAHQDTPLFLAESCAYANLIGGCPGKANCLFESMELTSSYGEHVTALDFHCRTIVLNRGAFCLAPRLKALAAAGAVSLRADFIYRKYAPEEVRDAWRFVRAGQNVPGGHAANFDRGLL